MASFPIFWLSLVATLGWCGAALRVSFWLAREGLPAKPGRLLKLAVLAPFVVLPFVLWSALLPSASARTALNFTYCWVTPCKLLLLAFANFLLDCPSWTLSRFSHFLCAFLLPLRIKGQVIKAGFPHKSLQSLLFDLCALLGFLSCYDSMAPPLTHMTHCLVLYLVLDLPHRISSMVLLSLLGVETQPAFRRPWLATSPTDFWGKRWDLTANALLRHSVYNPIVNLLTAESAAMSKKNNVDIQLLQRLSAAAAAPANRQDAQSCVEPLGILQSKQSTCIAENVQKAAPSSLVLAPTLAVPLPLAVRLISVNITFAISGLIHELLYYSLTQAAAPTWEVTAFFIVQGVATSAEITLRRVRPKHAIFKLPRPIKVGLTMYFMYSTAAWLFFPQLVKANIFRTSTQEYRAIKEMLGMKGFNLNTLSTPAAFFSLH